MVLKEYDNMDEVYEEVKQAACGRQACSVMLLVAAEVDAIASARILTKLFRSDNITYKIRPVANFSHIQETVAEFTEMDIKSVFMINCGAIYNIPKLFGLEHGGDIRCFIIDNHGPVHLANIHSNHNVVVLNDGRVADEGEGIPSDGSDLSVDGSQSSSNEDDDDDLDGVLDNDEEDNQGELSDEESERESMDEEDGENVDDSEEDNQLMEGNSKLLENNNDSPNVEVGRISEFESDIKTSDNAVGDIFDRNAGDTRDTNKGEGENEEDDDEDINIVGKKRKALRNKYDPKKARLRKLRDYYGKGNSFSIPTAVMLVTLVKNLNRICTNDMLWQAILGATDHFQRAHISENLYNAICGELRKQLPEGGSRGSHSVGVIEEVDDSGGGVKQQVVAGSKVTIPGAETGNIHWTEEYRFYMHRHWSLYESMYYSNYVASKLEVWKTQGTAKLKEMLARVGIPLHQSQQSFNYMTPTLRNHFRRQILESDIANDYGLDNPGVLYQSFYRFNSFKNPIAAADVVNAVNALLEMGGDESLDLVALPSSNTDGFSDEASLQRTREFDRETNSATVDEEIKSLAPSPNWLVYFNKAYDSMSMRQSSEVTLKKGISLALTLQKAIVGQGSSMLERSDAITRLKCFRYAFISRSAGGSNGSGHSGPETDSSNESIFGRPNVLARLAHFLMDVQRSNGAWAGRKSKPLILAAEKRNTFLVIGVVPATTEEMKESIPPSKFRRYFKMAADQTQALHRSDGFDTSVIEVSRENVNEFIEDLMFIMT